MRFNLLTVALTLLAILVWPAYATDKQQDVVIISSPDNKPLHSIAKSINRKLSDQASISLIEANSGSFDIAKHAKLIISIGNRVTEAASNETTDKPLLGITTKTLDLPQTHAQLVIQQPLCRQFRLIQALSDKFKTVAVINSSNTNSTALKTCARKQGLKLVHVIKKPYESLTSALHRALDSDVILALPDSEIYNSRTVKSILLQAYRKRIPLIGFSKSFVSAGALATIYSNTEQIADQASRLVQQYFQTGRLPRKPVYPDNYDVLINQQVSKSLQLQIPPASSIRHQLIQEELQ